MKMHRIIKSGYKTVMAHKLRSMFMMLSVVIGIAALTVVISLGKGTEEKIMSQVKKLFSSNTIMIVAGKGKMESNQRMGSSSSTLKLDDFEEIKNRVSNVLEWDAVQISPDRQVSYSGRNTTAIISGQTTAAETVWNIDVKNGRFFTEAENRNLSRVAVIAPNVAKELFGTTNPVGEEIRVENIPFQVIGVIAPRGMDPHGIDKDSEILIPLNTVLRRVVNMDYLMLGKILVTDEKNIASTAKEVEQILREKHGINGNEASDFMIVTPTMINKMVKDINRVFNIYLPIVALISLIVGSIVIANLMLLSVNERRKEIGLRKAVGAKTKDILAQFLLESSSITIGSGILGIAIGLFALSFLYPRMGIPYSVSWGTLIICFVISVLIGILSGYFPARKAANLQPVEALN
jgi:putative ABC transport system permease protein